MRIPKKWHQSWGWNMRACVLSPFSHVQLCVIPWTTVCLVFLSMGFSRQEYWSGLPCPSPGDLSDPGIKTRSPALQADFLLSEPLSESESRSVMSDSMRPQGLYSPWNSPGQNTEVGSLSLLQGIFPTQELNPGLPISWATREAVNQCCHFLHSRKLFLSFPQYYTESHLTRDNFLFTSSFKAENRPVQKCNLISDLMVL